MKFTDHNSPEKAIIDNNFKSIPYMDMWISSIAERYIYEKVDKVDEKGYRQEYNERYGKKEGEFKSWDQNGQLTLQCYYKEWKLEGEFKLWYENGQLSLQCYYKDGKMEGEYKSWWEENGQLWRQCYYKDGKKEGEYKQWYENGQLRSQMYYSGSQNKTDQFL